MHQVVWAGVPCSPCYNPEEYIGGTTWTGKKVFRCWRRTHECMAAITAEEVHEVVLRRMRALRNPSAGNPLGSLIEFKS
jgi:hypothetical protein